MKVKDIMTTDVRTCTPAASVADAAHLMWDGDCGILPVVEDGRLAGVVTDRDLFIALATRNAPAAAGRPRSSVLRSSTSPMRGESSG